MDKNGKGIICAIVIVILIGISGYLAYDKFIVQGDKESTINECKTEIKTLQNKIDNLKINNDIDNNDKPLNSIDNLIGIWSYNQVSDGCTATIKLDLKEDGTYTYENGSTCAGGTQVSGTRYALGKNKLYLFNDNCKALVSNDRCEYPNCKQVIELDYDGKQLSDMAVGGRVNVKLNHEN